VECIIPSKRLHRVLSKNVCYQTGALRLPSGDFTSSDGEVAKHLLMTHFSGCQPIKEHHSSERVLQDQDLALEVVTEDKVVMVLVPSRQRERMEYFPVAWRAVMVILYLNQVVIHTNLLNHLRPISLISFFLKTMVDSYIRAGPLNPSRLWNHSMQIY
jgi:hypothetical protein